MCYFFYFFTLCTYLSVIIVQDSKEVKSDLHILTFETIYSSFKDFKKLPIIVFLRAKHKEAACALDWAGNITASKEQGGTWSEEQWGLPSLSCLQPQVHRGGRIDGDALLMALWPEQPGKAERRKQTVSESEPSPSPLSQGRQHDPGCSGSHWYCHFDLPFCPVDWSKSWSISKTHFYWEGSQRRWKCWITWEIPTGGSKWAVVLQVSETQTDGKKASDFLFRAFHDWADMSHTALNFFYVLLYICINQASILSYISK